MNSVGAKKAGSRRLRPGQRAEVWTVSAETGERELVTTSHEVLLEAPNWTHDGASLLLNGDGELWRIGVADGSIDHIALPQVPGLNNDHVLAPTGDDIFLSASDGHIYRADLRSGASRRVTSDDGRRHYLHGVSPDGRRLAYVGLDDTATTAIGRILTLPSEGGDSVLVPTGPGHCDGPEYSPDGSWIYFNTEAFTETPGHAQIARVSVDGGKPRRLIDSDTVDWFPHLSPDGRRASYLRYPAGILGHPADLAVEVVIVSTDDWTTPLERVPVFGGQGTLNVNSWAPDSARLAYVAYPVTT